MDQFSASVWFFLIIGLGIVLAICIVTVLIVYLWTKRRSSNRDKVHKAEANPVQETWTDTSSQTSADGSVNGPVTKSFFLGGSPKPGQVFKAPLPRDETPEVTDAPSQTRIMRMMDNTVVLVVDDDVAASASAATPSPKPMTKPRKKPAPIAIGALEKSQQERFSGSRKYKLSTLRIPEDAPVKKTGPVPPLEFAHSFDEDEAAGYARILSEFEELETIGDKRPTAPVARNDQNIRRNRFYDIVPYEQNRVVLSSKSNGSDYINASYIDSPAGPKTYICTQGPIDEQECTGGRRDTTVGDFWQMVWQEDVDCIVMLTSCVEHGKVKCSRYWPEYAGESFELEEQGLVVEFYCVVEDDQSVQREFVVYKAAEPAKRRRVLQWHYQRWADCSAPESQASLLHFVRQVRASTHHSPVVVHCSAGVGRSGVFVAIDIALDAIESSDRFDVFAIVSGLRAQRVNMVQTADQYRTVYEVAALAVKQRTGAIDRDDLTSLDRNRWLSEVRLDG